LPNWLLQLLPEMLVVVVAYKQGPTYKDGMNNSRSKQTSDVEKH
jgi:hypothetical protein